MAEGLRRTGQREARADMIPLVVSGVVLGALLCQLIDQWMAGTGTSLVHGAPDLISSGIMLLAVCLRFSQN